MEIEKSKSDFINEWKPYIDAMATGIASFGCTIESDEELAEIIKKEIEEYNSNQEESKEELEDYQIDWLVEEIRETEKEISCGR